MDLMVLIGIFLGGFDGILYAVFFSELRLGRRCVEGHKAKAFGDDE